ncbi:DMT family transporter [Alkalibacillus haloalkaliphilus]|uniref:DMT family transporter n=1 Tax=Alkalibacillus haloalkaliphilus TaxID=94136 RepID=UPI00031284E0|nr:DMT family transporter [Alkalibacillus haloalkaliphilus]
MKVIYVLLFFIMMFWGFNVSAIHTLVNHIDPVILTAVRIMTAGVTVLIITKLLNVFRLPKRSELWIILYVALFNVVAHHMFVAIGLTYTSGINTGIILGFGPILTMVMSVMILYRKMTHLKVTGFLVGFLGVIFTTTLGSGSNFDFVLGDIIVFLSVATQAYSFILISKVQPEFDPRLLTGYMMVIGASAMLIISFFLGDDITQLKQLFDPLLLLIFLYSAVICTAFGHMTYNLAIKRVGAAESAIFINLNTFFAVVGAAIFLGETIAYYHFIGFLLILLGVFLGTGAIDELLMRKQKDVNNSA